MPKAYKDWTGHRFGRLVALEPTEEHYRRKKVYWLCQCDCGNKLLVLSTSLTTGHTISCGCFKRENPSRLRHGHGRQGKRTTTFQTWIGLRRRNDFDPSWALFENFLADMGEAPDGMTLDRISNARGYFKDNCRWATDTQQTRNRTNTKFLTLNGETAPMAEWAERLGIKYGALMNRAARGWTDEEILTTPVMNNKPRLVVEATSCPAN